MKFKFSEDDLLPLSGIQHIAFCGRQWALIHIERQWAENVRTVEGKILHEKADDPFVQENRGNLMIARSVPLSSSILGLYGIADVVEFRKAAKGGQGVSFNDYEGLWIPHPVEYKRGKPKPDDRDKVQLCAQAICLEEMYNMQIDNGALYYGETRHREQVDFNDELKLRVKSLAAKMHELFQTGITPAAVPAKHCSQCSLSDLCMPKLTKKHRSAHQYIQSFLSEAGSDCKEYSD